MTAMAPLSRHIAEIFSKCELGRENLHDYQSFAVQFLLDNPFSALFIDLGLGKTCISLTTIVELLRRRLDDGPFLVIGPLRVVAQTWPTEIGLWRHTTGLSFKHIRADEIVDRVNAAGRAARAKIMADLTIEAVRLGQPTSDIRVLWKDEIAKYVATARRTVARRMILGDMMDNPATVYLLNREQVEFLVGALGKAWPFRTVIIDESSSLKDHKTKRFKALAKVRPLMTRMHQLTATPAAETYLHLFAQIYLLDLGERFGKSYTRFSETYFTQNHYSRTWKLRPGAEDEITKKIGDICLVMKAEDYLDLQKPISVVHKINMPLESVALYKEMESEFIVELPSGVEIEAETAAALSQKLLQMASGVLYETRMVPSDKDPDELVKKRVVHPLHSAKIEKLRQLFDEANGSPLLVAYHFESSLDRLRKEFPEGVVMDREGKCIPKWNKGQIPIMFVHPQSGGHGLNLQKGGHQIVFFDIPWSLELYLQFIGRLARQGQKLIVVIHHLVATGTLDEAVVEALRGKRDAQELLFTLLKRIQRKLRRTLSA